MSLTDRIKYYDWGQIRAAYEKVKLAGGKPPTRLVCHPDHFSQAALAVKSLALPLRVDPRADCPTSEIYITGDEDL